MIKLEGAPGQPDPVTSAVAVYAILRLALVGLVNTSLRIRSVFPATVAPVIPLGAALQV